MTVPLRNNQPEELTTADLARGKRPVRVEGLRPKDALSGAEPEQPQEPTDSPALETAQTHGADEAVAMTQLFPNHELQDFRSRWDNIQTAFVDEPRRAVEQADSLVASAMKRLGEVFAEERAGLEKQWDRGDPVSTEDLRVALTRYRSFFQRLLAI
jgi:hypothetical protein